MNPLPKPHRVSDLAPDEVGDPVDKYLDIDLVIEDFSTREGDYGTYALIQVSLDGGSTAVLRTGAKAVMRKLKVLEQKRAFPITGRFERKSTARGRSFINLV